MFAVIYCRVSTEEESQRNALENQKQEALDCVLKNGWQLVDTYIDEGKSGTSTKKRDEYQRLFEDLQTEKFQVVVIKSQDRLMRNTREWYRFIDTLMCNGKKLYIYLEQKFYTSDDAIVTGIKAILAEEYSRELSKKIKNAHRHRQQQGRSILLTSATWGYNKENKSVVVNEEEAAIVCWIFEWCIQGYGSRTIANRLTQRGIRSRNGHPFAEGTVRRIIRNPIYKGTVVMNKRVLDFETKKVVLTTADCWFVHENALPPIVSEATWRKANEAMDARSKTFATANKKRIGLHRGRSFLSGKLFCGECGAPLWRRQQKTKQETKILWTCANYIRYGRKKTLAVSQGCNNQHISETSLYALLKPTAESILTLTKTQLQYCITNILQPIFQQDCTKGVYKKIIAEKSKLCYQKELLLEKLLNQIISDEDYQKKEKSLKTKIQELQTKEDALLAQPLPDVTSEARLKDIQNAIDQRLYDQLLFLHLFENVSHCCVDSSSITVTLPHETFSLYRSEIHS